MRRRRFLQLVAGLAVGAAVPLGVRLPEDADCVAGTQPVDRPSPKVFDIGKNLHRPQLITSLSAREIQELVGTTLNDLGRMRFSEVADQLQHYEIFSKWFRSDNEGQWEATNRAIAERQCEIFKQRIKEEQERIVRDMEWRIFSYEPALQHLHPGIVSKGAS